jgi:hypothetical protein
MTTAQLRESISRIAAHLKANPELMKSQMSQLQQVLPNVSTEKMRALVDTLATPEFDEKAAGAEFESILHS